MPTPEKSDQESGDAGSGQKKGGVDVERLADRVYRLMLAELRLEKARSGGTDH